MDLNEAILLLTDADRILAETANQDAGGISEAGEQIQEGDDERIQGDYAEAIAKYFEAWHEANEQASHD